MKKIFVAFLVLTAIFYSCSKSEDAGMPTACFNVSGLDSSKVAALSQITIDSIIRVNAPGYFVDITEGTPVKAYKRTLIFRYCGSASAFRSIYTGDATHIYVDPANPGNITAAQSGVNFPNDYFVYSYSAPGSYPITVMTSNVSHTGKDVKTATVTKTIVLQ